MLTARHDRAGAKLGAPVGDTLVVFRGVPVARTGDHVYAWGVERRDAAELAVLTPQLNGKPITVEHPDGLLMRGAKARIVGRMENARLDGEHALADLVITDRAGLAAIKRGLRELSLGYDVTGSARGEAQRGTIVDHLALVESGKCGSACTIPTTRRADSCCSACAAGHQTCMPEIIGHNSIDMAKPTDAEVIKSLSEQLAIQTARADKAETALTEATARADSAEGASSGLLAEVTTLRAERMDSGILAAKDEEIAKATERADKAEQKLEGFDARVKTAVAARVKLENDARSVMGPRYDCTTLGDRDIMVEVVSKVQKESIAADVSDDYARARFDVAVASHAAYAGAVTRAGEIKLADETARADAAPRNAEEARAAMIKRNREACKTA